MENVFIKDNKWRFINPNATNLIPINATKHGLIEHEKIKVLTTITMFLKETI
jgi:hypothetical protein